jgi:hypothetical protein
LTLYNRYSIIGLLNKKKEKMTKYKNIPVDENEYKLLLGYKKRVGRTLRSIFKEAIKLFIKKYKIKEYEGK